MKPVRLLPRFVERVWGTTELAPWFPNATAKIGEVWFTSDDNGTSEGLSLALNVGAMLISFLALIALLNAILGLAGLRLETILGYVFAPVAVVMGVPFHDARAVGSLLGTRMVTNEFIAYTDLGKLKAALDPRSFTIATFALCGFANFGSIGIQIGGIGALVPSRKDDLSRLGVRALLAGTLANFMTACIAGLLL